MPKEWTVTLNTGAKMPAFGLGTWLSKPGKVGAAVEAALKAGYIHIDCAHIYGNEVEIGEAMQCCFKEGVCKRSDLFITSKLWNTSHGKDRVEDACRTTLKNLQLEYLDLYLVHWPIDLTADCQFPKTQPIKDEEQLGYSQERMAECWEGMEAVQTKGLTRAIGVSNFTITKTANLLKTAKMVPAVNQVECHPYFQQQKLKEYCDGVGIMFEAYSPLGNPGQLKQDNEERSVLDNPVIVEVAKKHSATPAQGECDKLRGHPGPPGPIGPVGPPGETLTLLPAIFGAGSIFVRWGRTNCPDTMGTKALYYGRATGSSYNQRGGTSDMLCLPEISEYGDFYRKDVQGQSTVVGAEYETFASEPLANVANDNVPCAVCHVMPRNSIVTMPARLTCPDDWTTEYRGYLMTSHAERYRQSAVCVDEYPEGVCGEEDNTGGALLYHMVAGENGLDSPPYSKHEELSCVICTK